MSSKDSSILSRTIRKGKSDTDVFKFIIYFYIIHALTLQNLSLADIIFISKNNKTEAIFENTDLPFGKLTYVGLRGKIKVAEPDEYACSPITPPPIKNGDPWRKENWIALIRRSSCSFEVKVRMAMMSNYQAVIIQNHQDSSMKTTILDIIGIPSEAANRNIDNNYGDNVLRRKDTQSIPTNQNNGTKTTYTIADADEFVRGSQVNIPAVMVTYLDGFLIREHYISSPKDYTIILAASSNELPLSAYFFPFTTVFVVCLFIVGTFIIIKFSGSSRRRKRRRLSTKDLKQLKTLRYSLDMSCKYETCAICIEDYREGDQLRVLPCHHAFHAKCVDPWLTGNRCVCPICNARVNYSCIRTDSDFSGPGHGIRFGQQDRNVEGVDGGINRSAQTTGHTNNCNRSPSHHENTPLLQGRANSTSLSTTIHSNSISPSRTNRYVMMPKDILA